MRIALDAIPLVRERTGIGNYTRNLLDAMRRLAPEHEFYLSDALCGSAFTNLVRLGPGPVADNPLARALRTPFPFMTLVRGLLFLGETLLGRRKAADRLDIFLGTTYSGIFSDQFRTVIVVHDLSHCYFPEAAEPSALVFLREQLPEVVRRAACILTDSENSKQDIVRFLAVPPEKVRAIYLGVGEQFRRITDREVLDRTRVRYRLPQRFLLFVGTVQPRKNLAGTMRALAELNARTGRQYRLVVAGGSGWKSDDLPALARSLGIAELVQFTGFVADGDLPAIYNLADLFVLPSYYEGFGLPVVEAMACGVPVVTSATSSLMEVAGDAAVLVDPSSVEEIASGMERLLTDDALRERCVERGLARAATFTWERCARETLEVFRELEISGAGQAVGTGPGGAT
jgi:glycosyltransferase involved in cell wall biosynthesis